MVAYYNENDAEKAAVIRELIKANVVAPGDVDERSIADVSADDVRGYTQCHWFAGFAVWSYALRLAGWTDDREVWTGSCPCPSFSSAGKGQGFDDARHLWPDWVRLIRECKPAVVFGEQADDAIGYGWLDLVQTDLEAQAYAVGKIVLGACSVGAPHIRQRLYFVADTEHAERRPLMQHREDGRDGTDSGWAEAHSQLGACGEVRSMANAEGERCGEARSSSGRSSERAGDGGESLSVGDTSGSRCEGNGLSPLSRERDSRGQELCASGSSATGELGNTQQSRLERLTGDERNRNQPGRIGENKAGSVAAAGFLGGFWRDAEWLWCRDEKYRPVEPGTFPLAHGATNRVLKLRGYGDAINAEVAKAFIEAYIG